jgi:ribosomal protein S18 acetylase RimI-like enzyme
MLHLLERCSVETRFRRFQGYSASAGPSYIREIVSKNDHISHVMERSNRDKSEIVGVASVFTDPSSDGEIVVLVEDRWQRCGIGSRLIDQLCRDAVLAGILTLRLSMLTSNTAMRGLFNKVCPSVRYSAPESGVVEGVIGLASDPLPAQRTSAPVIDRAQRAPHLTTSTS